MKSLLSLIALLGLMAGVFTGCDQGTTTPPASTNAAPAAPAAPSTNLTK